MSVIFLLFLFLAGEVDVNRFVNSLTTVDIKWANFESSLSMFFYYVGITSSEDAMLSLVCEDVILVSLYILLTYPCLTKLLFLT